MKKKLAALYILIIFLPVAALSLLGNRAVAAERRSWQDAMLKLYEERLRDIEGDIMGALHSLEEKTEQYLYLADSDISQIRDTVRETGFIRRFFLLDDQGRLVFPPAAGAAKSEEEFAAFALELWDSGALSGAPDEFSAPAGKGWYKYYEGSFINYLYWRKLDDGRTLGFDIFREYLLSEVLFALPVQTSSNQNLKGERIEVLDEMGRTLYLLGSYAPGNNELPKLSYGLPEGLGGWRIDVFLSKDLLSSSAFPWSIILLLGAMTLAIFGAAFLFWRESSRELREAGRKVSFVNQVNHELRTPLTNIRMYAEMLEKRLPDKGRERDYAQVLVSESERLGRMIQNALSFSSGGGNPNYKLCGPDETVGEVLRTWGPRLAKKGINAEFNPGLKGPMSIDQDFLRQIIWNLISNVEKYAHSGKFLSVSTFESSGKLRIEFKDRGPGIPSKLGKKVFLPFVRGRHDINEGVSGTGLGLAISRDLARKHGGDLLLKNSAKGCFFELTLAPAGGDGNENTDSRG